MNMIDEIEPLYYVVLIVSALCTFKIPFVYEYLENESFFRKYTMKSYKLIWRILTYMRIVIYWVFSGTPLIV